MGGVARLGNDVEIAGQRERLFECQQFVRVADQPVHERELVRVLFARRGIAVGQIDAGQPHGAALSRDHRFDIARLLVMGIARQTARDLDRPLGEDGDAVEGLLPVGGDVVAEVLDLGARKRFVEALDFLQAQRVRASSP